ncbi:unnamed protein product [Calypogeia fissa]
MRQQVLSPEHSQGALGRKAPSKAVKGDDTGDNGRRVVGDGPSLDDDKPVLKMPGGRQKGSSTYHSKEHKGVKDQKDHKERKDEKDASERNDDSKADEDVEIKAPETTEAMDEESEGQNRRGQDGETLLQWGQRKRPRYREPSGLLKTSIRVDRRVVRADKQVAAQPASQSRGNGLRPSNTSVHEVAVGTAKRIAEASGSSAMYSECDHLQMSSCHQRQTGDPEEYRQQYPGVAYNAEKTPTSNSGGHTVAATFTVRRPDIDSFPEKNLAVEKMNLELFEWPKILTSLTRKEKEDDFTAIKGTKLPQRPKRRPKTVEKNVQFISPGTWLCDLTRERYEVREKKAVKKKPRGLKAMGSVDSDSD